MAAERIPYAAHVAGNLVKTAFGDYVQIFRLGGASFESADDEQLNTWHERLNVLWRNIASAQVALWAHVVRRREIAVQAGAHRTTSRADADGQ
jgi:type IV secretion system protein VirB4